MKRILLFTFISILLNSNLNAQEFVQKLDSEFCDCVSKETNYTDKTFEDCSEQVIPKYQNELEHFYSLEKNKNDRKNFMRDFMILLIRNCDAFYYHMEATKKIGVNNFKKEYKT